MLGWPVHCTCSSFCFWAFSLSTPAKEPTLKVYSGENIRNVAIDVYKRQVVLAQGQGGDGDAERVLESLINAFGRNVIPIALPIGSRCV